MEESGDNCGFVAEGAGASIVLKNCTSAYNYGSGIEDAGTGVSSITNCISFGNNTGSNVNPKDVVTDGTAFTATYNCFVTYSGFVPAASNVLSDPLFVSATDFRLKPKSPCVDSGVYIATLAGTLDIYDKLFPAATDEFNIGASQQDPGSGKRFLVID